MVGCWSGGGVACGGGGKSSGTWKSLHGGPEAEVSELGRRCRDRVELASAVAVLDAAPRGAAIAIAEAAAARDDRVVEVVDGRTEAGVAIVNRLSADWGIGWSARIGWDRVGSGGVGDRVGWGGVGRGAVLLRRRAVAGLAVSQPDFAARSWGR